jgi:hypothetical protein
MVKRQMNVEQQHRLEIQSLKQKELELAQKHIQSWAQDLEHDTVHEHAHDDLDTISHDNVQTSNDLDMVQTSDDDSDIDVEAIRNQVKNRLNPVLPGPRQETTKTVNVSFTSRGSIPTNTARETEDLKWLTRIKLAKALHQQNGNQIPLSDEGKNGIHVFM